MRRLAVTFMGEAAVETIYLEYRKKVQDIFFPSRGRGNLDFAAAKQAIAEFERVTGSKKFATDLRLFFVEEGIDFTNTYGDIYLYEQLRWI